MAAINSSLGIDDASLGVTLDFPITYNKLFDNRLFDNIFQAFLLAVAHPVAGVLAWA